MVYQINFGINDASKSKLVLLIVPSYNDYNKISVPVLYCKFLANEILYHPMGQNW